MKRWTIIFCAFLIGLSLSLIATLPAPVLPNVAQPQPQVVVRVLDPTLEPYADMWRAEISRRFTNTVAILAHGNDFVSGELIVANDPSYKHVAHLEDVIRETQRLYPERTVVVLSCNPDAVALHGFPNVYQAMGSVWCVPDRFVTAQMMAEGSDRLTFGTRWAEDFTAVGNIFEFRECQ